MPTHLPALRPWSLIFVGPKSISYEGYSKVIVYTKFDRPRFDSFWHLARKVMRSCIITHLVTVRRAPVLGRWYWVIIKFVIKLCRNVIINRACVLWCLVHPEIRQCLTTTSVTSYEHQDFCKAAFWAKMYYVPPLKVRHNVLMIFVRPSLCLARAWT